MEFASVATGSTGNMNIIRTDNTLVVVDLGLTWTKAKRSLRHFGVDKIDATFLTHEHLDHMTGVETASRYINCPIYATEGTIQGYYERKPNSKAELIKTGKVAQIGDLTVRTIDVYHDTYEPVGYIFESGDERLSLITDTGHVDREILSAISDSDSVMLEADYDIEKLRNSTLYTEELKARIRSDMGHLSNNDAAEILAATVGCGRLHKALLIHGSKNNNSPMLQHHTVRDGIMDSGFILDEDLMLTIADRDTPTPMIRVKD